MDQLEGRLMRGLVSGPVQQGTLTIGEPGGELLSLDAILQPYVGRRVSITIELLDSDAEQQGPDRYPNAKHPHRGRWRD